MRTILPARLRTLRSTGGRTPVPGSARAPTPEPRGHGRHHGRKEKILLLCGTAPAAPLLDPVNHPLSRPLSPNRLLLRCVQHFPKSVARCCTGIWGSPGDAPPTACNVSRKVFQSAEQASELQSLMRTTYDVLGWKKK